MKVFSIGSALLHAHQLDPKGARPIRPLNCHNFVVRLLVMILCQESVFSRPSCT